VLIEKEVKVDWIDSNVAVGSLLDAEEVVTLLRKDAGLIIDARFCFTHPPIHPIVENVVTSVISFVFSQNKGQELSYTSYGE